jgi:hypothetical protein
MDISLKEKGLHRLLMVNLSCEYDENGSFKTWHDLIKGPASRYVLEGRANKRRQRKLKVFAEVVDFYWVTFRPGDFSRLKIMQQGKNADGKPRKRKYMLDTQEVPSFESAVFKC